MKEPQLRHQLQMCQDDLSRARAELAATRAETSKLAKRLQQAALHMAALNETVARLQQEQTHPAARPQIEPHADLAEQHRLHLEIQALQHHRAEAHALRHSLSWRITGPLRRLRRLLGR